MKMVAFLSHLQLWNGGKCELPKILGKESFKNWATAAKVLIVNWCSREGVLLSCFFNLYSSKLAEPETNEEGWCTVVGLQWALR